MTPSKILPFSLAAIALGSFASAQVVDLGPGCPGGPVQDVNPALPAVGQSLSLDFTGVSASTLAGIGAIGFTPLGAAVDLGIIGLTNCFLRSNIEAQVDLTIPGDGTATASLNVPNNPALAGFQFDTQGLFLDAFTMLGLDLSNGCRVTLTGGNTPPQILGFTPTAPLGGTVTITGTGFGDDPDDLCIRAIDPMTNETALLRGMTIATDPTGLQVLQARVATEPQPGTAGAMQIHMFRGDGAQVMVTSAPTRLSVPGETWAWSGENMGQNMTVAPGGFTVMSGGSSGATVYACFQLDTTNNCIVVDLPADPCGTGDYPTGLILDSDVHYNVVCPGGGTIHYDDYLEDVTVIAASAFAPTIAGEHAIQIQDAFDIKYGTGIFTVTGGPAIVGTEIVGRIKIKPTDPLCVITGAGGKVIIKCP